MCEGGGGGGEESGGLARGRGEIGFALQPLNSLIIRMVSKEYLTGQININLIRPTCQMPRPHFWISFIYIGWSCEDLNL